MVPPYSVCIIGAGSQGLTALKNLVELNQDDTVIFDPEILEARESLGGLWEFSNDPNTTTTLKSTLANVSKWRNCYSDFPADEAWKLSGRAGEAPVHLNQEETLAYLKEYARKFNLTTRIQFGCRVTGLRRSQSSEQWEITCKTSKPEEQTKLYDKVVVATGQYSIPLIPSFKNISAFQGKVSHSSSFKGSAPFKDQTVLIVGFANTAADTANELAGTAKKVYISHRRGNRIMPRIVNNRPIDLISSRRLSGIRFGVSYLAPIYCAGILDSAVQKISDDSFRGRIDPKWRLQPAPSINFSRPMVSDTLVPLLESGAVESVAGIRQIRDAKTVELEDGTLISPNSIILCTGYERNKIFSTPVETSGELELSRLYQNIFHPKYADSLAYMNFWHLGTGINEVVDLMAMAIAQVFSDRFILPPESSRDRQIDQHHAFVHALAASETGPVSKMAAEKVVDEGPWRSFLHDAAGTQVNEMLGYGWQGWKFWWGQRTLCNLLMGGVDSPHVYRLFDGREGSRMKWEGAREAIEKVNEQVKAFSKSLEKKKGNESRKDR